MIAPIAITSAIVIGLLLSSKRALPASPSDGGGNGGGTTTAVRVGQTVRVPATDALAVLPAPTQQALNALGAQGSPDNRLENLYVRVVEIEPGTGRIRGDVIAYEFVGPGRAGTREVSPTVPTPFFYSPNARAL